MNILPFTKTYGGRTVLRFPGAALEPGRVYAVIGANGSGKSTLARVAAGAVPADQNSRILDRPVKLGYMPQRSHPFRMSTRANILLPGGEPERADMLMEALGLTVCPSQANYLLLKSPVELAGPLLEQGILIRSCANYHGLGPGWYRAAVRGPEENEELLMALASIL